MRRWVAPLAGLVLATACTTQQKTDGDPKIDPNSPSAQVLSAEQSPAEEAFQKEAAEIEKEVQAGKVDWGDVEDRMGDLTKQYPNFGLAWYNYGVAQEQQGKKAEAEDAYRRAMAADGPREAYENLAALALDAGDERQAMGLVRELVERDPGAAKARLSLAEIAISQGDGEEAVRLAREALSHEPKSLRAYCVLAKAAFGAKDMTRTRLIISQGFKLDPESACLHLVLGEVLMSEEATAKALAEYERAATKDPSLVQARFKIAEVSMSYKDFGRAIANYKAVTEANPKNAGAYVNLGIAYKGSSNFEEAEKAYLKAIEVSGNEGIAAAHFNLGVLYLRNMSRLDDAQAQIKRYLQVANTGSDDPAFGMLEEITQRKAMEEQMKQAEEEAARQAEIDERAAAAEAKAKAAEEAEQKAREKAGEKKSSEEPSGPGASEPSDSGEPQDPS